jgi:hypothetical protein
MLRSRMILVIDLPIAFESIARALPLPSDSKVEDVESLVAANHVVELLRFYACVEVQVCIRYAFFSLYLISDLSSGRVEEERGALGERVESLCR